MKLRFLIIAITVFSNQLAFAQYEEEIDLLDQISHSTRDLQQAFKAKFLDLHSELGPTVGHYLLVNQRVYDLAVHARTTFLLIEIVDRTRVEYAKGIFNADVAMFQSALLSSNYDLDKILSETKNSNIQDFTEKLKIQILDFQSIVQNVQARGGR